MLEQGEEECWDRERESVRTRRGRVLGQGERESVGAGRGRVLVS